MNEIFILTDYLNRFGSKAIDGKGFDLTLIEEEFIKLGFTPVFLNFSEIDFNKINFKNKYVIYTSIEDEDLFYKSFIEDVIWGIELQGGILIPRLEIFRAHHNKVFMEIIRTINKLDNSIKSNYFGSLRELMRISKHLNYPLVLKSASGAGSKGVRLVDNESQLRKYAKELSNTKSWINQLKVNVNYYKQLYKKGLRYQIGSMYRKKFIIQNFIPNLSNDWKVLIYGDKYYVLERSIRKNDFRASGSGNFKFVNDSDFNLPKGLLDFAQKVFKKLDCPNLSLDIAYNNSKFILIEFQGISFGPLTQIQSDSYFSQINGSWEKINNKILLESIYTKSIDSYIKLKYSSSNLFSNENIK